MKRILSVVAVLSLATLTAADVIATTDFTGNGLVGPDQMMDLLANAGSETHPGVVAAQWLTGPDLTANGTPGANSIWATGWDGDAGDYAKLVVTLGPEQFGTLDQFRFATRRSGSGPTTAEVEILVNGASELVYSIDTSGTSFVNDNLTDLAIALPAGATIEVMFTGSGTTSTTGSYRIANYFDGVSMPTGLFGTIVPEPASVVLLLAGLLIVRRR